mmetsp:Transcript_7474/g.10350  ORF Transcript_7474/g.10350 Transcript_7474/m.10350 type:complete len:83 (+) Transcript_7474:159-407(+)
MKKTHPISKKQEQKMIIEEHPRPKEAPLVFPPVILGRTKETDDPLLQTRKSLDLSLLTKKDVSVPPSPPQHPPIQTNHSTAT